jgi:hypothetical protein
MENSKLDRPPSPTTAIASLGGAARVFGREKK